MKQEAEKKLKLLSTSNIKILLVDVVKMVNEDIGDIEGATDIAYAEYTERLYKRLKDRYTRAIRKEKLIDSQRDLEDLISEIKSGEVPEWVNKLQHSKKHQYSKYHR